MKIADDIPAIISVSSNGKHSMRKYIDMCLFHLLPTGFNNCHSGDNYHLISSSYPTTSTSSSSDSSSSLLVSFSLVAAANSAPHPSVSSLSSSLSSSSSCHLSSSSVGSSSPPPDTIPVGRCRSVRLFGRFRSISRCISITEILKRLFSSKFKHIASLHVLCSLLHSDPTKNLATTPRTSVNRRTFPCMEVLLKSEEISGTNNCLT
eukprot:GHVS01021950.1.p1 GENE.GHVS01021950.1~~GHVS01021950.1.p1  ORF type:complete len:206 (+),score=37.84 GHVS01021950.1:338-955(+)